ncbi:hypothetical protein OS493_019661 [Desmophyllum pertusum]|uniref:MACPF domain-containing protein n=1 Tax=Desmophyllum pertusum TaxID=174260 RepID=A0A9W9ZC44_9CNID|nr:hypothetical protein OS493_019661 [Desmophyllum pertusum]
MQLSVFLVILGIALVAQAVQDAPKGLHFVGVGYNLLEGNPEGGDLSNGGVSFAPRKSCFTTIKKEVFSGSKSYQEKLNLDVEASGFEQMRKETSTYHNVFYEEANVCNRGRARYQLDLAPIKKFPVSDDFAAAVCVLPKNYDEKAYFNFIERWGTHIVVEVELGEKRFERSKSSKAEFTKYAMDNIENSVSVSGGYKGFEASLKVDMKKFRESMSKSTKFGEHKVVFTSGGPDMPRGGTPYNGLYGEAPPERGPFLGSRYVKG